MTDKNELRKKREAAVEIKFHLDPGEAASHFITRDSGIFIVSDKRILRLRSPDALDPKLEHDAPWEQSLYLPHGTSDPLVARTIIQTELLTGMFFPRPSPKFTALSDIAWEIMNSLISLRFIKDRLQKQIDQICVLVDQDLPLYTEGLSPKPLPIVEYFDIEFISFVNETRRALSTISELFPVLTQKDFTGGKFDKALKWAEEEKGPDSVLAQMLRDDQRWIKTWIDIRIAIEHPKKDKFVETLNFSLQPDRIVRLPTWRFVHPDYDMARPQNLLTVLDTCIDNLLKFYEDLQFVLIDGHLPPTIKIFWEIIPEADRDPKLPFRYNFHSAPLHP